MFRLLLRIAVLVLLAVGVPFAWHHKQKITESVGGVWNSAPGSDFDSAFDELVTRGTSMVPPSLAAASIPDRTSPPARDSQGDPLERVLSFNVTHQWVTQNFSRVSTIRTEPHLVGLRVAYVGGKRLDDVSGSLTYYFDAQASLRRITLMGRTGDPQHLLKIVQGTYGMLKEPHLRAGLFVARWNAVPMSALWITYADVIRSDQPYSRFEFRLEINRPSMGYQLSPQFQALLKADSRYDKPFVSAPRSAGSALTRPPPAMAADPAAEVQVVPPPAHAAALGLALQQCHRETAVHVTGQALRSYRQDSQSLRHLLAVFRGGQPVAAAWAQCMHGRTALLWGPAPLAVEQPADSDRLLAVLLRRLREEGYSLLQSIADGEMAGDASHPAAQQSLLARHGFLPPVELLYLVSTDLTMREPPGELTFEAFREGQESRLEQLVGRTYDGTLDIPVLNDVRRLGDVLDGYRHTGHVTPQHWLFARQGGRDVGCLLLSDHPESDCLELVYMGTVPEVRGQGHGRQLVSRAMEAASAAGRDRLILAVDAANQPARRHYEQAGMKLLNRRNVSIRILSASRF